MKLYFNTGDSAFFNDPTLTPNLVPIEPSYSTSLDAEYRMNTIQYGNGYKQREPDGLNNEKLVVQVVFQNMRADVIKAVDAFLRGGTNVYDRNAAEYFFWQPPAQYGNVGVIKMTCDKWRIDPHSSQVASLSATFEQTFEP